MSTITRSVHLVVVPALIFAFGCTSTSSTPPTPEPANSAEAMAPVLGSEVSDVEVSEASPTLTPVYFETDMAELQPEARETLNHVAESMLDHPEWGVLTIAGHCDERGSDSHNLALGSRRAAAVERQLVQLGVPRSRLVTRSYGAQRPAVQGHSEKSWRYNRRSELSMKDTLASL